MHECVCAVICIASDHETKQQLRRFCSFGFFFFRYTDCGVAGINSAAFQPHALDSFTGELVSYNSYTAYTAYAVPILNYTELINQPLNRYYVDPSPEPIVNSNLTCGVTPRGLAWA